MPSPFPGMDPVIESQRFDEFHSVYLVTLTELTTAEDTITSSTTTHAPIHPPLTEAAQQWVDKQLARKDRGRE